MQNFIELLLPRFQTTSVTRPETHDVPQRLSQHNMKHKRVRLGVRSRRAQCV